MTQPEEPILVDTNTIIEAHRVESLEILVCNYRIETVEECVTETQTGFPNRPEEQQIDARALRSSLAIVHFVEDKEKAKLALQIQGIHLDDGEEKLWAHALSRDDMWLLCGPDTASIHAGVRLGFRERLITLESLFNGIGHNPRIPLRDAYTERWLRRALDKLVLEETFGPA
ncbi:MAG: hypothetical protein OXN23_03590 [Gammaproteobacteria bacterium]|nr:hypothetical protein [Gammaproteobacteria bacterium]MDE0301682.1 hypothetical protein [Gammaproteobacteria bacterium]MDE0611347.1 hypothetical protein [Gammaproteobacteria bacterium]